MAVAAYASLVSLTYVLDNIHYRAQHQCPPLDIKLIETLQESVNFLLEFVEAHSLRTWKGIEALWRKVAEVAFEAEDIIDFHVLSELHWRFQGDPAAENNSFRAFNELFQGSPEDKLNVRYSTFTEDMQKLIAKVEFIKKEIPEDKEEMGDVRVRMLPSGVSQPVDGSSATTYGGRSIMVGFDKHMNKVLDVLTRDKSKLQIFPIVGPGGIGKTTLAKCVFDHPVITCHFDTRLWVTISQEYSIQQVLRSLLDGKDGESVARLGEILHKKLFGRRYLIVIDDVWCTKAWDDLKMFFPNNNDGSWIMITTRLVNVADYFGSHNPYFIDFLNSDESSKLLCQKVFAQDDCPHKELKEIGEFIAKSCRGLPLLINVIGGLLAKSNMTKEYWEYVAQNVNTLGNLEDDEYCLRSLALSYDNLSIQLKACFLSMRNYREDTNIQVSDLLAMWIAEGLIKLAREKSLEEIAKEHFKELIDRNLIFARNKNIGGEIMICGIHDLLRDLCLRKSEKECFLYSPRVQKSSVNRANDDACINDNVCVLCSQRLGSIDKKPVNVYQFGLVSPSASKACSFLCNECEKVYSHSKTLKLVRVMKDIGPYDNSMEPSSLRACCLSCDQEVSTPPSALHLLWNVQVLILYTRLALVLPSQIWEMSQLRILQADGIVLPDPEARHIEGSDFIILKNLHTLLYVNKLKCTKDIFDRIPHIKTLGILQPDSPNDLTQLHKLESLVIQEAFLHTFAFPTSLKELMLVSCQISGEHMTTIGSLPNLEELHLDSCGKDDKCLFEGEFSQLKGLSLRNYEVIHWSDDPDCFPKLEWLVYHDQDIEIPLAIGCKDTLRSIELQRCGKRAIESAKKIWEEHLDMGNENLRIACAQGKYQFDASSLEKPETVDRILKARNIRISL